MIKTLERVISRLEDAEKAASLETASFGFPNDRIEIKHVHCGCDRTGVVGDVMHPDEYIKKLTKLHHGSWIISPIREAKEILLLHTDLLKEIENLRGVLEGTSLFRIAERIKGNVSA